MRWLSVPIVAAAAFAAAVSAQEQGAEDRGNSTALELRLRTIESRLPDADRLDELEAKLDKALAGSGGGSEGGATAPASDRVAALEEKVAQLEEASRFQGGGESSGSGDGSQLFSLYQDIQSLRQDVRELRGQIEELQHQARQREQRQRDLYQDLDSRLQALEQEAGLGAAGGAGGESGGGAGAASDDGNPEEAEKAYLAAFEKLKNGKQKEAVADLEAFVEAYPRSEYTDNGWYWLGQAHYVDRSYDKALNAFRRVLKDFPDSPKAADAAYKVGVVQDEQGDYDAARKTLREVIEKYPESDAAGLARKRLEGLDASEAG